MDEVDELDADDDDDDSESKPKGGKALKTLYELNDTLFAEAEVDEDGNVGLWLGVSPGLAFLCFLAEQKVQQANTMLLYPLAEAVLLLSEKLAVAKRSLRHTKEDLEFLREQITVMEVNFARVHNVSPDTAYVLKHTLIHECFASTSGTSRGEPKSACVFRTPETNCLDVADVAVESSFGSLGGISSHFHIKLRCNIGSQTRICHRGLCGAREDSLHLLKPFLRPDVTVLCFFHAYLGRKYSKTKRYENLFGLTGGRELCS